MLLGLRSTYEVPSGSGSKIVQPVIRSSSTGWKSGLADTSYFVSRPTGLAVGDLMISIQGGDADQTLAAMVPPSGFGAVGAQAPDPTNNIPALEITSRVATAADVSTNSFQYGCASGGDSSAVLIAVQVGTFDTSTPLTLGTWAAVARTVTNLQTAPSMTGVASGMLLALFATDTNNTTEVYPSGSPPSGMTFVNQQQSTLHYSMTGVYSQALAAAGATGAKSVNTSPQPATSTNGWSAVQLLINPAVTVSSAMAPNAGVNASVTVNTAFNRTGTYSGSPTSFAWKVSSGPAQVGTVLSTTAAVSWTPSTIGTYVLTFFTTNATGTAYDQVTVNVTTLPSPAADAGSDAIIDFGGSFVRTGIDSNSPTSRSWTITAGPSGVGTTLSSTAAVNWTPSAPGIYTLTYSATNSGGTGSDTVTVTVSPPRQSTDITIIGTGSTATGTTSTSPLYPTANGLQIGDIVYAYISTKPSSAAIDIPAGWSLVGSYASTDPTANGVDTGPTKLWVFRTILTSVPTSTDTVLFNVNNAAATNSTIGFMRAFRATVPDGGSALAFEDDIIGGYSINSAGTAAGGTISGLVAGDIAAKDRLALFFGFTSDVPTAMSTAPTASITGVTFSGNFSASRGYTATGQGNDSACALWEIAVASGPNSGTTLTVNSTLTAAQPNVVMMAHRVRATYAPSNQPVPVVDAGADATGTVGVAFTRTATETNAPTAREWTILSGPSGVGDTIGTAAALSWTPVDTGTYVLRYTATNAGGSGSDDVTVVVNPPAPVVNAGADSAIARNHTFNRGGSATNSPTSVQWTIQSGPAGVVAGTVIANIASLSFTATIAGTYILRLTATNASGSAYDECTLTISAGVSDPTSVTGLVYRMRPTNLGLAASAPISSLPLLTGGLTLAQSTPAAQPTFLRSGLAGEPGITFDGGDDLRSAANMAARNQPLTIVTVYRPNDQAETNILHLGGIEILNATNEATESWAGALLTGNTPVDITFGGVSTNVFNGTSSSIYLNGALVAQGTTGTAPITASPFVMGNHATVGARFFSGDIYEVLVFDHELTVTEHNTVLKYVEDVYGIGTTIPPVANAGADATITAGTAFTRTGSATNSPASYAWTVVSGPANVGSTIATTAALSYSPTVAGTYTLRFAATNAAGTGTDDLILTVNPGTPVPDAGADATIVQNGTFARTGTATNSPTSVQWTLTSGPAGTTAGTVLSNAAALNYSPSIVGTYVLRFTATNAAGTAFDELTLTVTQSPPVVDAGVDASVFYGQTFTRTGTGTNSPTAYSWTITSGPSGAGTTIGSAAALSWAPPAVGTYVLRLTASNSGGSAFDELTLTVTYAPPSVDAGVDAAINLGSSFARTAIETLQSAPVTSRAWTILSGPTGVGSTIGSAAALNWTPSVAGTYVLRYTLVTSGGTATDDVQVVVTLQPPTANAGADASVLVNNAFTRTGADTGVNITARTWTIVGPNTVIGNAAALSYTPTQAGVLTLRYTVTNAAGTATDDLILTVNGPPIVDIGADISVANRTAITRNATETGGGGITARTWTITAGPTGVGSTIGNTSTLSWTPTLPGTYTLTYTATNPYGSGTDTLIVSVSAIVIQLASSSLGSGDIINPNLQRRALYRLSGTALEPTNNGTPKLGTVRLIRSISQSDSTATAPKPRKVSVSTKREQADSLVITANLATRRTFKESIATQGDSTITGKLTTARKIASSSVETTPTVTSRIVSARKLAGYTQGLSSQPPAALGLTRKLAASTQSDSTATLRLNRRSAISEVVPGDSIVRLANLIIQKAGSARTAAVSDAIGTLVNARRIRSISTENTTATPKLGRTTAIRVTANAVPSTSRRLNSTIREAQTVVQAGFDYTVRLSLAAPLLYDGMIGVGRIYIEGDIGGALRQLSGTIRSISDVPGAKLNRATRVLKTELAVSSSTAPKFYRIGKMAAQSDAGNQTPPVKLVRLRTLRAPIEQATSSVAPIRLRSIRVYFRRIDAEGSMSRRLGLETRFRLVTVNAVSRLTERSGFAVLTTAKAVTTSPQHRARQVRVLEGYVTAQSITVAYAVVAPKREYTQAVSSVVANLRRRGVLKANTTALSQAIIRSRKAGKLSTVIRVFEGAELDAYIEQENYTGDPLNVTAPAPPEVPVFRRNFLRPR